MGDGKGECCIARWDGGHVTTDSYNTSKMDMIMLKYRPIAPKPMVGSTEVSGTSEGFTTLSTGSGGKIGGGRGRKKTSTRSKKNSNNSGGTSLRKCTTSNGRKIKSSSPDNHDDQKHDYHDEGDQMAVNDYQKADLTLLPLFPEAPDLSPTLQVQNIIPNFWVNFDNISGSPCFEDNYSHCHPSWC